MQQSFNFLSPHKTIVEHFIAIQILLGFPIPKKIKAQFEVYTLTAQNMLIYTYGVHLKAN